MDIDPVSLREIAISRETALGTTPLWAVQPRYELADGHLTGEGAPTYYLPFARPALASELAKLHSAADDDVLRFVHQWGLLGYRHLISIEKGGAPGEPASFVRGHARTLHDVFTLRRAFRGEDPEDAIGEALQRILYDSPDGLTWDYWSGRNPRRKILFSGDAHDINSSRARGMILAALDENLMINLGVRDVAADLGELNQLRLRWALRPRTLLTVAYWHVAQALIAEARIEACRHCGSLFIQKDKRQQFCPPPSYDEKSLCGSRHRQREYEQRKAEADTKSARQTEAADTKAPSAARKQATARAAGSRKRKAK